MTDLGPDKLLHIIYETTISQIFNSITCLKEWFVDLVNVVIIQLHTVCCGFKLLRLWLRIVDYRVIVVVIKSACSLRSCAAYGYVITVFKTASTLNVNVNWLGRHWSHKFESSDFQRGGRPYPPPPHSDNLTVPNSEHSRHRSHNAVLLFDHQNRRDDCSVWQSWLSEGRTSPPPLFLLQRERYCQWAWATSQPQFGLTVRPPETGLGEGETIVLCGSSGFQRGDRALTPPCMAHSPLGFPGAFPLQTPTTVYNRWVHYFYRGTWASKSGAYVSQAPTYLCTCSPDSGCVPEYTITRMWSNVLSVHVLNHKCIVSLSFQTHCNNCIAARGRSN